MSALSATPQAVSGAPGTGALLATGCGTAMASVCAAGLFQIEQLVGGFWSAGAILLAGVCCALLARTLARLTVVVPSGAGLLAYLSRGLGRPTGLALALPYLLLTLFLVGAEATIVGALTAILLPVPAALGSLVFLIGTWVICRSGIRIGYRAQALATWSLVVGLAGVSLTVIAAAGERGELLVRLATPAPDVGRFLAAIGQALFLFMGFELITSQVEAGASPPAIGRALTGSVAVLAGCYALLSLGFSCVKEAAPGADWHLVPHLGVASQAGGGSALVGVALLSLLASFTSFNGALLTLSRFTSALAAQKVLPGRLARLHPGTLVPREALATLLVVAIGATALVGFGSALRPSILAAACSAAVVYAALAWTRERPPFAEPERSRIRRAVSGGLALALGVVGVGVVIDAGPALAATLALLGVAYSAALLAARRVIRRQRGASRGADIPVCPTSSTK
jgi:basic amino acid/polyamine antiporter, APA family